MTTEELAEMRKGLVADLKAIQEVLTSTDAQVRREAHEAEREVRATLAQLDEVER